MGVDPQIVTAIQAFLKFDADIQFGLMQQGGHKGTVMRHGIS